MRRESFAMRKRILIVDDDTLLTRTINMCLSQRGHDITVASSGIEAVKQLFKEQPDLLVLDIGLPDCDGWFLTTLLKKLGWADRVPVIMMSVLDPDRGKISETKPYAYIQKPFDMGHLIHTVEKSLGEKANLTPCSSP